MKSGRLTSSMAMILFTVAMPVSLAAQDKAKHHPHQYHHYQLIDVGTFGGPQSLQYIYAPARGVLNNSGALGGWADTSTIDPRRFFDYPDCYAAHAFAWQNGATTDLGLLPGGTNSQVSWIAASGLTAGEAGVEGCDYSLVDASTAAAQSAARPYVPSTTQHPPRSRWSNRFHLHGLQSVGR